MYVTNKAISNVTLPCRDLSKSIKQNFLIFLFVSWSSQYTNI